MAQTLEQYIKDAPQRDAQYALQAREHEDAEDTYYMALSALIDEHPIGRPMSRPWS